MGTLDIIRTLCTKKGISIKTLEKELGFSNGSLAKSATIKAERLQKIAEYFDVTVDYLMTGKKRTADYMVKLEGGSEVLIETEHPYYLNVETQKVAQDIFENDRVLFDVYRSSDKERLIEYAKRLKALREMEEGEI